MYYILLSLAEERHGYEIMQVIKEKTFGGVLVGPGTLYSLLSRFEKEGMINQVSNDGRRKTYILTESGKVLLVAEYNRLKFLVEDGCKVLFSQEHEVDGSSPDLVDNLQPQAAEDLSPKRMPKKKKRRPNDDILF